MNEPERPTATYGFRDVDSRDKPSLVKSVFDRVADRYDIMNDVMS
ncbi:MAG TPA: bifunctional demethylmenaquinone methyltransferase/2-methoxy-6-polyprenyl-1,4-benzoquinol methylase, partial [Hyphomonadaceae bacterium]|nr:bifunctional demethylmenaquinone methyltransferase/2-methoxy-6-polyprenyl-1,4-benzoquinol methylase [Hyphomonadaceae bacterium]